MQGHTICCRRSGAGALVRRQQCLPEPNVDLTERLIGDNLSSDAIIQDGRVEGMRWEREALVQAPTLVNGTRPLNCKSNSLNEGRCATWGFTSSHHADLSASPVRLPPFGQAAPRWRSRRPPDSILDPNIVHRDHRVREDPSWYPGAGGLLEIYVLKHQ